MSAAAVGLVLGTKQFLPNNIYGWCSLLTESALSPRSPGISKHRHEEHAFGTEFEAIYGLKKRPIETKELGLPEEKSLLRRIVSTDIQSFETPQTDSGRPHTIMDKRSRLVRSGDRSPVNGRVGLPENPPQCGLVYGLPVPQDCLAAFNLVFFTPRPIDYIQNN